MGLTRKIIIGKHSGTAALILKLKELDIDVDLLDLSRILMKVRKLAVAQKAPLLDEQLKKLVKEVASNESGYC